MPKVLYISFILCNCGTGRDAGQYKRQVVTLDDVIAAYHAGSCL